MAPRYLLDTNICIYIQRHRPPEVYARFEKLKPGEAAISAITWGELLYGAEKSQHTTKVLKLLQEFITLIPVVQITAETSYLYGKIRADLELKGTPIGNNDLWIAAHAQSLEMTLVTNNTKEFKRVSGLKVQNWIK